MNILGIGILFSRGRGISSFENALRDGWQRPEEYDIPRINKKAFAYIVKPEHMEDKGLLKKMRRADRFSKMAVIAASDAIKDGKVDINKKTTGIILSTAFGAHQTTFDFLDDIIDYGEVGVSPTTFSNSVHNAAASYIASALDITGPTLTVTRFFFSFQGALQLARTWINDRRCDHVLVGAVDVCGEVMRYCFDKKLGTSKDGKIRPFNFTNPSPPVPGEGSVFFLVSGKSSDKAYCRVVEIDFSNSAGQKESNSPFPLFGKEGVPEAGALPDIDIIDADGMTDGKAYMKSLSSSVPAAAYSPLFGSLMTGSAFNCAAGALMIKKQMQYASPVIDDSEGLNPVDVCRPAGIDSARSIGCNCLDENVIIYLRKA
jgi:3-oxoacyl-[acyl-carrier-protein] synthase II